MRETARLRAVEDYTNKYKGEQVEIALFGGEYQDGVLTAYCYLEDVAHVELNGHILIPLQNVASLHCSSRCDAPEPDWPPRGLAEDDTRHPRRRAVGDRRGDRFLLVLRNVLKGWADPGRARRAARRARLEARRLPRLDPLRSARSCCSRAAIYAYADRIVMGMLGARELVQGEAPALHSTVERLALGAGIVKPRLYVLADSYPRALSAGRGAGGGVGARDLGRADGRRVPGRAGGHRRARDRAPPPPRRARADGRGDRRDDASSKPRASAARSSARCSSCSRRSRRRSCTSCSRRSASTRPTAPPPSSASRRTGSPTPCCGSSRRWSSSRSRPPGDRAALHDEPVRREGPRRRSSTRIRRSASASSGCASSTRTGARSYAPPSCSAVRKRLRAPCAGLAKKWAASYSPGGLLPEYHRR